MRGKRFLAILLTLCMAAGFVPATVWAADAYIASQANVSGHTVTRNEGVLQ